MKRYLVLYRTATDLPDEFREAHGPFLSEKDASDYATKNWGDGAKHCKIIGVRKP